MRISSLGMAVALSSALYVVENFVPFPLPVGRWGISNSVVLFSAYNWGLRSTVVISTGKSLLGSLLSGRFLSPTFFMGFLGSIGAGLIEWVMGRFGFGYVGASVVGSVVNNSIQMAIGAYLIKSVHIFSLFPIFLIFGTLSAIVNAYIAGNLEKIWGERG